MELWITLGVIGALAFFIIVLYNRLIALRQEGKNAFADVEVHLKQRYDLIPNLVETVKGYAKHEQSVFENVTKARAGAMNATGVKDRAAAENNLSSALMNLYAVSENYPELKANENFLGLQREISDIENKIAASRRFFNNAVTEYNVSAQQFPAVIIAKAFGFHLADLFELDESEKDAVNKGVKVSF